MQLHQGYIATDNTQALREDEVRYKAIPERIPQGRWGTPADFGGPAVFWLPPHQIMNGEILTVMMGWMGAKSAPVLSAHKCAVSGLCVKTCPDV